MRTVLFALLAAGAVAASPAAARSRPARTPDPASERLMPRYQTGRGYDLYSRQPGSSGIITSTTPNASGNLGGPSTGGGGGGGA